jgi:hypothetical protein
MITTQVAVVGSGSDGGGTGCLGDVIGGRGGAAAGVDGDEWLVQGPH